MIEVSFELPHTTLAGFSNGNVDKPLVLALHGWMDNAGSFEPMSPYLENFHLIAIDLPGHGLSKDRSVDAHYHFVEWIHDICALIQQQNWQRLSILGHSMGGMIGQAVAAVMPERISRLALIDALGFITTPAEQTCEQLRQAMESREKIRSRTKAVHDTMASALKARVFVGDIKSPQAQVLAKRGVIELEGGYVWRSDPRLRTHSAMRFSPDQAKSILAAIECPVLLVAGRTSSGAKMIERHRQQFGGCFIELRSVHIDGGHHCHMEHPVQAARLVDEFLGMV